MENIKSQILESIELKRELLENSVSTIKEMSKLMVDSLKAGNFLYLMGNGGSAADAQHIAGELVGRFKMNRKAVPVLSFTTDTSVLTAIANDFGYDCCFSRQVEAFVRKGDVVFGISTSGNSQNILNAINLANEKGAVTIALTGNDGGLIKNSVDLCLNVPSADTARVQECHLTIAHILCEVIEKELFS